MVVRNVYTEISRSEYSDPDVFTVLNIDVVFAKLELLTNSFLDRRTVEHFACCWVLLSQFLGIIKLEIFSDVILGLDLCRVDLVLGLLLIPHLSTEASFQHNVTVILCFLGLDTSSVGLPVRCVLDLHSSSVGLLVFISTGLDSCNVDHLVL